MLLKSNKQYFNCKSRIFPFSFSIYSRKPDGKYHNFRRNFNHINSNLFAYAANNPVKYTDPDGRILISFTINHMQNIGGTTNKNIPHTSTPFSSEGCSFATMTGIIDDYRSKHGMDKIDWNQKLENGDLNAYFVSQKDVDDKNTTGSVGDLKRAKLLSDFTGGKLKILKDISGNDLSSEIDSLISDKKMLYVAGRAKVNAGSHGKVEHEVGIVGKNSGTELDAVGSSKFDKNRNYKTDGDIGRIKRIIVIGE